MMTQSILLEQLTQMRDAIDDWGSVTSDAEGIEALRIMAEIQSRLSAKTIKTTALTEAFRLNDEAMRGVPKVRWGNGLAAEVALARRDSPARGTQFLKQAVALVQGLPKTFHYLETGQISEEAALVVAKETSWLSKEHRTTVDELMEDRLTAGLGPRQLGHEVRAQAYHIDPSGAVKRQAKARSQRRVSLRPAPEGMAYLTALLPMPEAVGSYARLHKDAQAIIASGDTAEQSDPTKRPRTRDQLMADLLVERVTGQSTAKDVSAEVLVVMTDTTLFGDDDVPAWISGQGPLPAGIAKEWLATKDAKIFLRRVYTRPSDGHLVSLDSRSRSFRGGLRKLITLRDNVCRTPYCDAPIREIDHITPVKDGGKTTWENGSGLCAACNQIKENIGWQHASAADGLDVSTPTGHTYTKRAGPLLPGHPPDGAVEKPPGQQLDDPPGKLPPNRDDPIPFRRRRAEFLCTVNVRAA